MCNQTCGLTHSILVTVPFMLTGLFASNSAANAWCAVSDAAAARKRPNPAATATTSFVCIGFNLLRSAAPFSVNSPSVPLVKLVAFRNLPRDVDDHRLALPALDERLLAQTTVHEFFGELHAAVFEKLRLGFQPSIERHRDLP